MITTLRAALARADTEQFPYRTWKNQKNYADQEINSFVLFAPLRLGVKFFFLKCIYLADDMTKKELAFLYDLYVASDWGERWAELIDRHVKLPERGRVLYVGLGTGGHALELQHKAGAEVVLFGVEEDSERMALARAKAATLKVKLQFSDDDFDNLDFPDGHFALVIGDLSWLPPARVPEVLPELARVAAPGATVNVTLPTAGSYGEFISLYWEALFNEELDGQHAESLVTAQPTTGDVTVWAQAAGLAQVTTHTNLQEWAYESGTAFVATPLVAGFLLPAWLSSLPDDATRARITQTVTRLADAERQEGAFSFSLKATLLTGTVKS